MITLNFQVDPRYLVYYTITRCAPECFIPGQPVEDVVAFQNYAWKFDREANDVFRHGIPVGFILNKMPVEDLIVRANKFLDTMAADPAFTPILNQTAAALSKVKDEWEANLQKSHDLMSTISGLELTKEFEVYVTHPSQTNGMNLDGRILWTDRHDFNNYNTVYLWHEIMHSFIDSNPPIREHGHIEHAIIQLMTDEELRVRFNGGTYPPFIGHEELRPIEERLLPAWRSYLRKPHKDIRQLIASAKELS
jgi:hypothetical protein